MRRFPVFNTILFLFIAFLSSAYVSCTNMSSGSVAVNTQHNRLWVVDGSLSKDHQTVVAQKHRGDYSVFSLETGKPICDLETTGTNMMFKATLSPDGKILASVVLVEHKHPGSIAKTATTELRLYSAETGKILKVSREGISDTAILEYSANGDIFGISEPGIIRLWSAKNGTFLRAFINEVMKDPERGRELFKISPDGKYIVYLAKKRIYLWSVETGDEVYRIIGNDSPITAVAFSPDSKTIAFGHSDKSICLNSTSSGELLRIINPDEGSKNNHSLHSDLEFSPEQILALNEDGPGAIGLRKIECGELPEGYTYEDPNQDSEQDLSILSDLEFSPDGKILAAGEEGGAGAIRLWSVESGELLKDNMYHTKTDPGYSCGVTSLSYSPDSKSLISFSCGEMKEWNIEKVSVSTPVKKHEEESIPEQTEQIKSSGCVKFIDDSIFTMNHEDGYRLQISPDGSTFATWDVNLPAELFSISTGLLIQSFGMSGEGTQAFAFSSKGDIVAIAGTHSSLTLWTTDTGEMMREFEDIYSPPDALSFNSDGQYLLVATRHNVQQWSIQTGKPVRGFSSEVFNTPVIRLSPDGRIFGVYTDSTLNLNSSANGKVIMTLEDIIKSFGGFDFSPDSQNVAYTASGWKIRIKEISTGRDIFEYSKPDYYFWFIKYTPDGKSLIAFDLSKDFYRISLETGEIVQTFRGHLGKLLSGDITPDGKLIITESMDNTIKFWKVNASDSLPIENRKVERILIEPSQLLPSPEFHGWEYVIE